MAAESLLTHPLARFWYLPVLGLTLVGAGGLAVQYSSAYSGALGTTAGVITHDVPHLVDSFQTAQNGGTAPAPVTPASPAPVAAG